MRTATLGDFTELVAALLPCMWGYSEIGQRLVNQAAWQDTRYARWIEMYAADDFGELAQWCREICDEAGEHASSQSRDRMREAFELSSRHELAFWEAAWQSAP